MLGPGLLESTYDACLAHEFDLRGFAYEQQKAIPLEYKGVVLDASYRLDFIVEDELVIEVKSVERLLPLHEAQVITYLRMTGLRTGLLVNFNAESIRRGLRRLTLHPPIPSRATQSRTRPYPRHHCLRRPSRAVPATPSQRRLCRDLFTPNPFVPSPVL